MAPFGKIYSLTNIVHPRTRLALAVAALGSHEVTLASPFVFGQDNKTPSYLAKFPLGKIPAFEGAGADNDGFFLSESNAIAQYLADTAPKPGIREQLLGATAEERAKVQQWLWFTFLHFEPSVTKLCLWRFGDGERGNNWATYNAEEETKAEKELKRWFEYLDGELQRGKWLAGTDKLSLADLAVCGQLYTGFTLYIDKGMRDEYPRLVAYYERLLEELGEAKHLYDLEGKWLEVRKPRPAE